MSDIKNNPPSDKSVSRAEFEKLEGLVGTLAKAIEGLTKKVNEAPKPVNSLALETEKPKAAVPAKPFTLEGVGELTLKYPTVRFGGAILTSADIENDAELAGQVYGKHPNLFILKTA